MHKKSNLIISSNNNLPPSKPPYAIPTFCDNFTSKYDKEIKPEMLKPLLNTYIYIWLKNGSAFWMYPVKMADNLLCGYIFAEDKWEAICISNSLIKSYY